MNINDIADRAHNHAKKAGFLDPRIPDSMLMDIQDEISEVRKSLKENKWPIDGEIDYLCNILDQKSFFYTRFTNTIKDTVPDELADLIIIPLVIARHYGIDIEKHIEAKMKYNELKDDHK